jgi:hypothetical protein
MSKDVTGELFKALERNETLVSLSIGNIGGVGRNKIKISALAALLSKNRVLSMLNI